MSAVVAPRPIGEAERLSATMVLSLLLHGMLLLGLGFALEDAAPVMPTLDVILTQTSTALTPKQEECGNLIVPVCLSATHIAYGSIRMEPVFMAIGESSAYAACMAIEAKTTVQKIDYPILHKKLLSAGQILEFKK